MTDPAVVGPGARGASLGNQIPPRQRALRARCVHPSGAFEPFAPAAVEQSVAARFEEIARRHPDRLAIKTDRHALTYDALNRMANRIAHAVLDRLGDASEPVALLMEKDAPLVAAEVGLLKAGKILVPLDPSFPEARLAGLLADCRARLVLTTRRHRALLQTLADERLLVLEVEALDRSPSDRDPGLALGADTLAHLLYTSGSTGKPKGVVHSHRAVLHLVMRHTNALHVCADDRITVMGSMSAGQAMLQVFVTLLNGGAVFPWDVKERGLADLAAWLHREGITYYRSSASIFRRWAEELGTGEGFPTLRLVGVASEPVYRHDFERYRRHFGRHTLLVNALSSTETGVVRLNVLDHDTPVEGRFVPVGYPVDDMELLLLDEAGREVEPGDVGEIAVRSRGLAHGYWRDQRSTEAAFRPDPGGDGAYTYNLGDVGRMERDGALIHLGRADARVKIRGHRIELGEIEAALREVEGVREAAVVDREDHRGDRQLVAYVVPVAGAAPTRGALRQGLESRVPAHMIPSAFASLDELPRAPSGKVDRRALPALSSPGLAPPGVWTSQLGLLGTQLCAIWEQLLGVTPSSPGDDFLELGGNSLLAVEMLARIEDVCGRAIAPSRLLGGALTIERLVEILLEGERASWGTRVAQLQAGEGKVPLFFAHGDFEHGGLYCRRLARELGRDLPFYAMTPHGLDGGHLPWSIEAMAADLVAAVRAVRPTGPYRLGGFCNGGVIAFEMARQLEAMGEAIDAVLLVDARALNAPPGFRLLSRAARLTGRARRWSEPTRRAFHLRLRLLVEAYGDSAASGGRGRLRFVLGKVGTVSRRALAPAARAAAAAAAEAATEGIRGPLMPEYGARLRDYAPGRYAGRVVLFRSSHLDDKPPGGPTAGWRHVARAVDVHAVPGNHQLAVTRHVEVLAEKMRPYLT